MKWKGLLNEWCWNKWLANWGKKPTNLQPYIIPDDMIPNTLNT